MPIKPIVKPKAKVKAKVKAKPVVKRKPATPPAPAITSATIAAIGNRNLRIRQGAEGLELETVYGEQNHHLATLVFDVTEARKLRDALVALVA